jgi:pyruvate dehydrogenase E2 component (dihydrolipoamide acetyltransferase)
MPVEVVMPKFGLTMQAGTIRQWYAAEGESIAAGQPLFEVETEKVLYDVEAPAGGVVAKRLYPVEATVPCARVLAVIACAGEDPAGVAARYLNAADVAGWSDQRERATKKTPAAGVVATPAARKLAKDSGVDLAAIAGSGPGGRITREDVEAAVAARGSPLRGMRKTIAERMLTSLQSTAQLTLVTEADVTPLVRRRAEWAAQCAVTYTDMIVVAAAAALGAHPRLRVTVEGDALRVHERIHIGIAVALDEGLIVPVIRDADRKTVEEIADVSRRLVEQARAGTLGADDVSGGVFTITNLGMYGIDAFTPILHLPQVAILGVGRIIEKPAVHEGQIAIRSLMTLSLTFDHRIIDGAPAAAFLQEVGRRLSAWP